MNGVDDDPGPRDPQKVIFASTWEDLPATFEGANVKGWHVYEIVCTDLRNDASARVSSALFRDLN